MANYPQPVVYGFSLKSLENNRMSVPSRVWETTVGIALRDTQWLILGPATTPNLHVSLTGTIETRLGDVAFEHEQRFFLFELKGSRAGIRSEWKVRQQPAKQAEPAPAPVSPFVPEPPKVKHAHTFVLDMVERWKAKPDNTSVNDLLLSLRGHHFVYWDEKSITSYDRISGLVLAPYLFATLEELSTQRAFAKHAKSTISPVSAKALLEAILKLTGMHIRVLDADARRNYSKVKAVPISSIYDGRAGIHHNTGGKISDRYALGLTANEFSYYAGALLSGIKSHQERLNAVVLGTHGFRRTVRRLQDIANILPPPTPAPNAHPSTPAASRHSP
jgi:hypothetical protein